MEQRKSAQLPLNILEKLGECLPLLHDTERRLHTPYPHPSLPPELGLTHHEIVSTTMPSHATAVFLFLSLCWAMKT